MLQTAVFVDAGYLYAQGSALLDGSKQQRNRVRLNVPAMLQSLLETAQAVEPGARLLRVYWYDGLRDGYPQSEQRIVADSENVKCRFGTINKSGEQKGVDSLIVTDLIELSRSHAISDAVIMSGDEDIRVGVQIAQTFGIRVHLLGIYPARGSQSPGLRAEADTVHEWAENVVSEWMKVVHPADQPEVTGLELAPPGIAATSDQRALEMDNFEWMARVIEARVTPLTWEDAQAIYEFSQSNRNHIPQDFDRPSLGLARRTVGRDLSPEECKKFRAALLESLRVKVEAAPSS